MRSINNVEKKDWVAFILGIIISVLFVVFCTDIYEVIYYEPEFANEMYNQNMYTICAIFTTLVCWGVGILYYWILEIWFTCDRWFHWLISIIVVIMLAPSVTFVYSDSFFQEANLDFYIQERNFAIVSLGVSVILYLVLCFCIKGLSMNNRNTPF